MYRRKAFNGYLLALVSKVQPCSSSFDRLPPRVHTAVRSSALSVFSYQKTGQGHECYVQHHSFSTWKLTLY